MSEDVLSTVLGMLTQEQKEELVARLIADVGNLQPEHKKGNSIQTVVNEDFTVTKNSKFSQRKKAVQGGQNTWIDNGESKDPDYDPEKYEAMGRKTRQSEPRDMQVEKQCHVCGKSFKIHSSLVMGSFIRCNNCTG